MTLDAIKQLAETTAAIAVPLGGASGAAWRWVLRPHVVTPVLAHFARVAAMFDKVDRMEGKVNTMHESLGRNGGKSLADEIYATADRARRNEARLTAFADHIAHPIFECDSDGEHVRANKALCDQFGYAPAELLGRGWINLIYPDDRDRVVREWMFAVGDARACAIYARYVSKSGVVMRVRVEARPSIHEKTGAVVGYFGGIRVLNVVERPVESGAA